MFHMVKNDPELIKIGKIIRALRLKKKMSQEKLGAETGLDRTYISDIELGTRNFGIKNLLKLAKKLEVKASYLLKEVE